MDSGERSKPRRASPFCLHVEDKYQEDRGQFFFRALRPGAGHLQPLPRRPFQPYGLPSFSKILSQFFPKNFPKNFNKFLTKFFTKKFRVEGFQ